MSRAVTTRRWFAFGLATSVLLTGLLLLSSQASGTSVAPLPDTDEPTGSVSSVAPPGGDSQVVDRLNTWAETKGKRTLSPARGGSKTK
jgi:hypothetical protein